MMMLKKNVLVLASTFPRRPDDTDPPFIFELCRRLAGRYCVHVVCPRSRGAAAHELREGVLIRRFPYFFARYECLAYGTGILTTLSRNRLMYGLVPFFILGEIIATVRVLANVDCRIVNAHWLIPQGLAAWIAQALVRSRAHLVCSLHGGDVFALKKITALKKFIISRSSAVIVVSAAMRDAVIGLGVRDDKVHLIPMGVDLQHTFVPSGRCRRKKSVLFVGRLVEKKGAAYLVRAFQVIAESHPEARLTIVGDGPERATLEHIVRQSRLEQCVEFRGAVSNPELPAIYQEAEIVVLPFIVDARGDMEGFGLVVVEALGCECAVVASDLPALRDTIVHQKTGLLVRPKNIQDLVHSITRLLENDQLRRDLGSRGRSYVRERFDWRHSVQKYTDLFEQL
jgi:glycosyltransferase involved in cell wall biosynthesis